MRPDPAETGPGPRDEKDTEMNAIPYEGDDWDRYADDDDLDDTLPPRPRRQLLTRWTAILLIVIFCAAGFYAGVRVEKGQLANSASASPLGALASRFGSGTGGGSSSRRFGSGTGGAASFFSRLSGAGGAAGGLAGALGAAGGASVGTVSSVSGKTIYVTETGGNTVKVKLTGATTVTKNESVKASAIHPGDSVVVSGASSSGTVTATSVSDTGSRTTTSGSSGSGAASSGASAVNSLFGGGGG
jgi:hypothetical protein